MKRSLWYFEQSLIYKRMIYWGQDILDYAVALVNHLWVVSGGQQASHSVQQGPGAFFVWQEVVGGQSCQEVEKEKQLKAERHLCRKLRERVQWSQISWTAIITIATATVI